MNSLLRDKIKKKSEPNFQIKKIPNTLIQSLDIETLFNLKTNNINGINSDKNNYQNYCPTFENFDCSFCYLLVKDPIRCENCKNIYCKKCINQYNKDEKKSCPKCKEIFKEEKIDFITKNLMNYYITINCLECNKEIIFDDIEKHFMEKCEKIDELYKCQLCHKEFLKNKEENFAKKIEEHKINCENIIYFCENCGLEGKKNIIEDHMNNCKGKVEKCEKCDSDIFFDSIEEHQMIICESLILIRKIKEKLEESLIERI